MLLLPLIALWWSVLAGATCGWGFIVHHACGRRHLGSARLWEVFWPGFALMLGFLLAWHLFLRVGWAALVTIIAVGAVGWWRFAPRGTRFYFRWRSWPLFLLAGLLALGIAAHAVGPVNTYDTGLYHLPAVNWTRSYPVVPGLGNLHGRLGFNQSFFLLAAALDEWPWRHQAIHLANGFVFWAFLLSLMAAWAAVFRRLRSGVAPALADRFLALMLGPGFAAGFGLVAQDSNFLSGLSPENTVLALGTMLVAQFLRLVTLPGGSEVTQRRFRLVAVSLLIAAGLSVKLSFAGFAAGAGLTTAGWLAWRWRTRGEEWLHLACFAASAAALVLAPWVVHGVILSGYPAFPSTLGALPVDWRVPAVLADSEANWIRSCARQPGVFWLTAMENWNWLPAWLDRLPDAVTIPLRLGGVATLALATMLTAGFRGRDGSAATATLALALPAGSLLFWWFTAPDPRFAGAAFWGFSISLLNLLLVLAEGGRGSGATIPAWSLSFNLGLLLVLPFVVVPASPRLLPMIRGGIWGKFVRPPQIADRLATTSSGLQIHVPADRAKGVDSCWDMPLPNTPYFRSDLELRHPPSLRDGFRSASPGLYVDFEALTNPAFRTPAGLSVRLEENWEGADPTTGQVALTSPARFLIHAEKAMGARLAFQVPGDLPPRAVSPTRWFLRGPRAEIQAGGEIGSDGRVSIPLVLRRGFNVFELGFDATPAARTVIGEISLQSEDRHP